MYHVWFGSRPEGVDSFFHERVSNENTGMITGVSAVDAAAMPSSQEYNQSLFATMNNVNENVTVVDVDDPTTLLIFSMC